MATVSTRSAHVRFTPPYMLGIAAVAAFAIPNLLTAGFQLSRDIFLAVYIPCVFALVFIAHKIFKFVVPVPTPRQIIFFVAVALVAGAFACKSILGQPAGAKPPNLPLAIAWDGIAYGAADAVLLVILPSLLIFSWLSPTGTKPPLSVLFAALLASLAMTAVYHLGFAEFRSAALIGPLIGNSIVAVAFLITRCGLVAIAVHIAMHITALLHGMETTSLLPPHYR